MVQDDVSDTVLADEDLAEGLVELLAAGVVKLGVELSTMFRQAEGDWSRSSPIS